MFSGDEEADDPASAVLPPAAVSIVKAFAVPNGHRTSWTAAREGHGDRRRCRCYRQSCSMTWRYTFYVWLDNQDALRCSNRSGPTCVKPAPRGRFYRLRSGMTGGSRSLSTRVIKQDARAGSSGGSGACRPSDWSLTETFRTRVTRKIKYQRASAALGFV